MSRKPSATKFLKWGYDGVNHLLGRVGFELRKNTPRYYLHTYSSYEEYREIQVKFNKKKLNRVFADESVLSIVADRVKGNLRAGSKGGFGLCHGSRNGFEQNFLRTLLGEEFEVIGTDISETASLFENSVQWDFHDQNKNWLGKCDFIYTNSLDQSWKPNEAVLIWINQLKIGGLLVIEHTVQHTAAAASEMDPFGADPIIMPYLLSEWLGHKAALEIVRAKKSHSGSKTCANLVDAKRSFSFALDKSGGDDSSQESLINRGSDLDAWLFIVKRVA